MARRMGVGGGMVWCGGLFRRWVGRKVGEIFVLGGGGVGGNY